MNTSMAEIGKIGKTRTTAENVIADMDRFGERLNSFRNRLADTLGKYSPPLPPTCPAENRPCRERPTSAEVWVQMFVKLENMGDLLTEIESTLTQAEL